MAHRHPERERAARRTQRAAWAASGLCSGCGGKRESHFKKCERCRTQCLNAIAKKHDEYKAKKRAAYWADPEGARAANRAWAEANKELKATLDKAYYMRTIDERLEYGRRWYAANKARVRKEAKETRQQRIADGLCTECGARRDSNRKLCSRCADRLKEQGKRWRATASKSHIAAIDRRSNMKRLYGLTLEKWHSLFEAQNNQCALCGTDKPGGKGWQTDHCHTAGGVRAILCGPCNLGLGCFKDNPEALERAAAYLRKHQALRAV